MTQELLSGLNGYNIPCRHTIQGGESMVCLITHGFGSSKDSPTAQLLAGELPRHGIGTLALDLPAHGDSPVDGDALSIRHCLDDLARAEARALELAPGARVVYFSSSFGAYLNLIYLSTRPHRGTRSFLRSAAVEMPLLFHTPTPEQAEELARQGFLMDLRSDCSQPHWHHISWSDLQFLPDYSFLFPPLFIFIINLHPCQACTLSKRFRISSL